MISKEKKKVPTETQRRFEHIPGMSCFACAPDRLNPGGLHLVFEETDSGARTTFRPSGIFQSYPGFLHGGILCAVLDETMAYAGVFKRHVLPFTRNLEVRYRAAVSADREHVCESEIVEGKDDRFTAKASIRDDQGKALVTGKAEFIIPTLEMAEKMMPGVALRGFEEFFIVGGGKSL